MSRENSSSSFAFGILFGALVGAIAGILLAPAPGEETRKKVVDVADKVIDKVPDELAEAKKCSLDVLERVKISVENQIQKINEVMKQNKLAEAKKKEEESIGYEI